MSEESVECPYCGREQEIMDLFEYDDYFEYECENCEKEFNVSISRHISLSSSPTGDNPECPKCGEEMLWCSDRYFCPNTLEKYGKTCDQYLTANLEPCNFWGN